MQQQSPATILAPMGLFSAFKMHNDELIFEHATKISFIVIKY
jgi:hypothetical protein